MTDLFQWVPPAQQFSTPDMHRKTDHQTAIDASERVAKSCKTELQSAIYEVLIERGPMTDGELETLPQFSQYGPSTVRKRRSELYQAGRVTETGEVRARMKVWKAIQSCLSGCRLQALDIFLTFVILSG